MKSRSIILLLVVMTNYFSLVGQDLNVGLKYGAGFSSTHFAPKTFTFSTIDNETDHILGIQSEKIWSSPILNIAFKTKNRLGLYLDMSTQTFTYQYHVDKSISNDETAGLYTPRLAISYFSSTAGVTIDLIQTKLIKPYIKVGASLNSLLLSSEQKH
ncbi:MAG: hypothetical protein KY428_11105, partial [Bacteroidetes bacterium]|nr:hypothetical protein [Bacteroidota bacterium]